MTNNFLDKSSKPSNEMLSDALGRSYKYWQEIKDILGDQYGKLTEEWKYYSAGSGWTLKLLLNKRNLFFFSPCEKYFRLTFIFGNKAVNEVEHSNLPDKIIEELINAKRYIEGRGLRIDVKKKTDVTNILKLVAIKVHN
jgi:hypothetical protein